MRAAEYRALSALALAGLLDRGEVSLPEVYAAAAARAAETDARLRALAWADFDAALARAKTQTARPFRGLPTLLKDLNTFKTGWPATQGSAALATNRAGFDSYLVQRLEAGGLVPAGQTTTPEFGLSLSCESPLWGITRNPFDQSRTPGGSSGGSAAAVAAGIVPLAHATDSAGSIRIPAAHCGLFGLKPSRGRVPLGPDAGERMAGLSHAHVLTRSVRDSALALDLLQGPAAGDPYSAPPGPGSGGFLAACDGGVAGLRIALCPATWAQTPVAEACQDGAARAAALLSAGGAHVEVAAPDLPLEALRQAMGTILTANVAAALRRAGVEPGATQPMVREAADRGRSVSASDYIDATLRLQATARSLGTFLAGYNLWLTPTTAAGAPQVGAFSLEGDGFDRFLDRFFAFSPFVMACSAAGVPAASVPLHWPAAGEPVGVQLAARLGGEALVLAAAAFLETAQPWSAQYLAAA